MLKVAILLASYNGEQYISEQINSIFLQKKSEVVPDYKITIYVSDDGSTDNTVDIVNFFSKHQHNEVDVILLSEKRKGGVQHNFQFLINNVDADYYFFSDQDDFWLPNKVAKFMENLVLLDDAPALVYSDLCVVDELLFPVSLSMMDSQKLNKTESFLDLLIQNSVTGCVVAFNKNAVDILRKFSISLSTMHDWYSALIVSCFGEIKFIPYCSILYRQHLTNQVGAKKYGLFLIVASLLTPLVSTEKVKKSLISNYCQTKLFLSDASQLNLDLVDVNCLNFANVYFDSFSGTIFDRFKCFMRVRKFGFFRNVIYFIVYVLFGRKIVSRIQ